MATGVDPAKVAEKWARRLAAAREDIISGVQSVTESPAAKAVAKKDKLKARWIQAIDSGKWENALRKVSLEAWKESVITRGVDRVASGAEAARPKMADFFNQLLPYVQAGRREIERMPAVTIEDSINRATWWIRYMSKFQKR